VQGYLVFECYGGLRPRLLVPLQLLLAFDPPTVNPPPFGLTPKLDDDDVFFAAATKMSLTADSLDQK
jgi:hypothetical protein